jgi:hypothetical protein
MKAEAIALQEAANGLIFHTGKFTQVFVNHMKNFHFMTSHLAHNAMEYDDMISLFKYSRQTNGTHHSNQ